MNIAFLRLQDFRSYHDWTLEPDAFLTILIGPNAAGKTNAVEAIQLATAGTSFRQPRWEDLVRWGARGAAVELSAVGDGRRVDVRMDVLNGEGRSYKVNGTKKRRLSDVAGKVPSVVFTPEDLAMVKGSSERRRAALDDLGEQLSAAYRSLRRDFVRAVRQRNAALKDDRRDETAISAWDEQLVSLGARLVAHRVNLLRRLAGAAAETFANLSGGESLEVSYEGSEGISAAEWTPTVTVRDLEEAMRSEVRRRAAEERARGFTLVGPHRDDVRIRVGGADARTFASQGQQRSVALSWKLAEVRAIEDVAGVRPVLLLDDVMSELDEHRRGALTSQVQGEVQTVVTTTNLGYFSDRLLRGAKVVELTR